MPGLLLWIAADILIQGQSRALAWRLLHDPELASPPGWLGPWLPAGAPFDRDPLALLLAGGATGLAAAYLAACLGGACVRVRGALFAAAIGLLVLLPSGLYMSVGFVTGRPFGQDGGVVQLPLALERLLDGKSPYGADYSESMLGRQARASAFWRGYGGNPIVRHHAYLPGTHLLMLPPYFAARVGGVAFDPRAVTLVALTVAALLAAGLFQDGERRLSAAALVALNPLVYWHQAFGANDMLFVATLLGAARLFASGRTSLGGALLGLACATKQLAWAFAPFLLLHAAGDLRGREALTRLRGPLVVAAAVFTAVVAPVAALDARAFFGDIVLYNLGLGGDLYPFGGTPGIGFANVVLYLGGVRSLREPFSFGGALLLLVPLGLGLARMQLRRGGLATALAAGSVALLATLYFSRVPHPSYLIAVATLLPLAALLRGIPADAVLVPLSLLALAATAVERGVLRLVWQDARDAGLPAMLEGTWALTAPKGDPGMAPDPLGLALSGLAAGLALVYAAASVLGTGPRARRALSALAVGVVVAVPTLLTSAIGAKTRNVRGQERAVVPTPSAREAWSTSFRLAPPAPLEDRQEVAAGSALVSVALRAAGFEDGRALGLVALAAAAALAARVTAGSNAPLTWALVALLPPAAFGALLGSDAALWLGAILFLLVSASRVSLSALRGSAALAGLAGLFDTTLIAVARPVDPFAGLGLVNLAAYAGRESSHAVHLALGLGTLAVAAVALWTWRRAVSPSEALAGAALALLLALFFAPAASPFRLAIPLALIGLAAAVRGGAPAAERSRRDS